MKKEILKCDVCGITNEHKIISTVCGKQLCSKHKAQFYRHGFITDPTPATTRDKNKIIIFDDHAEVIITDKCNNELTKIMIDLEDVDLVSKYKWRMEGKQ